MSTSGNTRTTLISPFQYFADPTRARPVFNGFIYIGRVDGDPTNTADQIPVQVICECGGNPVNVTQPIRTGPGGVPIYNGSPAQIVVCRSNYSITLQDKDRVQVYHSPDVRSGFVNQPITHLTLSDAIADDNSNRQAIRLLQMNGAEYRRAADQAEFDRFPTSAKFTDASSINWVLITESGNLLQMISDRDASDNSAIINASYGILPVVGSLNIPLKTTSRISVDDITDSLSINHTGISEAVTVGSNNAKIKCSNIETDFHGIQCNTGVINNIKISETFINATRFGILLNDGWNNSSGVIIRDCNIVSSETDSIELNNPSSKSSNVIMYGNTLSGGVEGTASTSGFAVGIAGIQGHITALNYSSGSRLRGYHMEDLQTQGIQLGNVWNNCLFDGAFLQPQIPSKTGDPDGPISIANHYRGQDSVIASTNGMHFTRRSTEEGSLQNCITIGNSINRFATGIRTPANTMSINYGNVSNNCNIAISIPEAGYSEGITLATNTPTLARIQRGAICGGVISNTQPTTIVSTPSEATDLGGVIKRFAFPITYSHAGAGSENIPLFALPVLFSGRVTAICRNSGNTFFYSANIDYDGTNLTTENEISTRKGNVQSTITPIIDNGNLSLTVTNVTNTSMFDIMIDFNGVYYMDDAI